MEAVMSSVNHSEFEVRARQWFDGNGWKPFEFQTETWQAYWSGQSGIVSAPTGYGKTNSLCVPALCEQIGKKPEKGLRVIWLTPIRALTKEIAMAWERAAEGLNIDWRIEIRTGDTATSAKSAQLRKPPHVLITTPESLHVLMATKGYSKFFSSLDSIVIDEWHELVGSKRGVLVELGLSRLLALRPGLRIWGISATIGNMEEAQRVLFGTRFRPESHKLITAKVHKDIDVIPVVPEDINEFPWAGYYGLKMVSEVLEVIKSSNSTIIFTNTRSMCENWYQKLLDADPDLSGMLAMHHGSISRDIRDWVEEALHDGRLKAVVSTSSLDLGVDFRPVDSVVQIGSPKGVARCIQRAGRSGHQPGALSKIYFVPTHALELIEAAALRKAIKENMVETRMPYVRSFDVLVQYLVTLAVSEGFRADVILEEIRQSFSFESISETEWKWVLSFVVHGGSSLEAYDEFKKVEVIDGTYVVRDRRVITRHKLSIGTIVSSSSYNVKYLSGKRLGSIEENFIARLNSGDVFWFAGRSLEFVRMQGNNALVRKSSKRTGRIPSWGGGRMQLSSELSQMLRRKVVEYHHAEVVDKELEELKPLLELQSTYSAVPDSDEFLVEMYESRDGHHVIMYPFEGRFVHEGMGTLLGQRIARMQPITFTIAMNDYGFELLSDQPIEIEKFIENELFAIEGLEQDIIESVNAAELSKLKFHDICRIAGLVFQGYPGRYKKDRHLQASTGLMYQVFQDYDPNNLLFQQAYDEAMYFQLEKERLKQALERIGTQKIIISRPDKITPFALPIVADGLRGRITSEKVEKRIERMKLDLLSV